jgi:hypothetical protein
MTPASLATALRDCAAGPHPLEAGTGLLIAHGTFLHLAVTAIRRAAGQHP